MRRTLLMLTIALIMVAVIAATAPLGWSLERLPLQADEATFGICKAQGKVLAQGGNVPDPGPEIACAPE